MGWCPFGLLVLLSNLFLRVRKGKSNGHTKVENHKTSRINVLQLNFNLNQILYPGITHLSLLMLSFLTTIFVFNHSLIYFLGILYMKNCKKGKCCTSLFDSLSLALRISLGFKDLNFKHFSQIKWCRIREIWSWTSDIMLNSE